MHKLYYVAQSSTFHSEAGLPCLRVERNVLLREENPQSQEDLSKIQRWNEFASDIPINANMEFSWGRIIIENGRIKVFPTEPGEYVVPIPVCKAGRTDVIMIRFTVIQAPWKLQRVILPHPTNTLYDKEDVDVYISPMPKLGTIVAASRRGRSHEKYGDFRDDDFAIYENQEKGMFVLAVADGAGSKKFSREGSRLAVNTSKEYIEKILMAKGGSGDGNQDNLNIEKLVLDAAYASYEAICAEVESKKSQGHDLNVHDFDTTLLIAVAIAIPQHGLKIVSFSVGDGAVVWATDKEAQLLSAPDSGSFAGETKFLTSEDLWQRKDAVEALGKRINQCEIDEENKHCGMLMLMTDGVADPFFPTVDDFQDSLHWCEFKVKLCNEIGIEQNKTIQNGFEKKLLDWLDFRSRFSFDDRTLCLLSFTEQKDKCSVMDTNEQRIKNHDHCESERAHE